LILSTLKTPPINASSTQRISVLLERSPFEFVEFVALMPSSTHESMVSYFGPYKLCRALRWQESRRAAEEF
jgi:hypothetical protein